MISSEDEGRMVKGRNAVEIWCNILVEESFVRSLQESASRVSRFSEGEVMLCIFDHREPWDTTCSYWVSVH